MTSMKELSFALEDRTIRITAERLVVAGYTGRNPSDVQRHIRELELHGVPPPPAVPIFYDLSARYLSQSSSVRVPSRTVSGEAEAALIFISSELGEALVTVGSDLTDRALERRSILEAKELPKPIATRAWRYRDVRDFWDALELISWITPENKTDYYQRGTLAELLRPEELLDRLPQPMRAQLAGTVLLLGTIPLCQNSFSFSQYFACELVAPDGRALRCDFTLEMPHETRG